ncbi:cupin [Lampropedia cohaerens]|uniref:Cupin n=1 Tax=Lampropedia cohaerens TaxID=1610491 RepID=A0A0U1Q2E9_9BURK|nr:cupin domain-containing protein [Lampropedia cohaerens]KKW68917.1 cupin [Lampropedia cohaerens]
MDINSPLQLLGGLSPAQFMRKHWQRKPLLVRQALPAAQAAPVRAQTLFTLAAQEDVQTRLIRQHTHGWTLEHGPFKRRQLPALKQPGWTLLVQGVDLADDAAHALLQRFAFIPQARLDDLMISYASDRGGVGPHFDSYDVFLLQAHGKRRWRIGRQRDLSLQPDVPLRILQHFEPEYEWVLEPGDMLYLPPRYAHDGIAEGNDCMTCSIGFRAPAREELASTLLERLAEPDWTEDTDGALAQRSPHAASLYKDTGQSATQQSAAIPQALQAFAREAIEQRLRRPHAIEQLLGEYLSEPKPDVVFGDEDEGGDLWEHLHDDARQVMPSRRTRMLYDDRFFYINGESYRMGGRDARLLRQLADQRSLRARDIRRLSAQAQQTLQEWHEQGWILVR